MKIQKMLSAAALIGFIGASAGAAAETWQLPEEIAPKKPAAAAPAGATPAPAAAAAPVDKEAKAKECKAQSVAKGLHGKQRKQFLEDCAKS